MPVRQSERIARHGKTTMDKAKALLEIKIMEKPAYAGKSSKLIKNSFASICAYTLVDKAKMVNISMANNSSCSSSNVDKIKNLEIDRMKKLHHEQPEIFLPIDIDYNFEDAIEEHVNNSKDDDNEEVDGRYIELDHDSHESSYRLWKSGKSKYRKTDDRYEYRNMEY
jgi:hypothetical protein